MRAQLRALLGPKTDYTVDSRTEEGQSVLSSDERSYRSTWTTTDTLIVRGRPAWGWLTSHYTMPDGKITVLEADFENGRDPSIVAEKIIRRLKEKLKGALNIGAKYAAVSAVGDEAAFVAEWERLTALQLAAWEAEDGAVIVAAHATWNEEDRLATEADDLKAQAERLVRSPAGNEVGEPPASFDSRHSPVEELRDLVAALRTWLVQAEEARQEVLRARGEREIAAHLANEERLAAIVTAMAAPAIPAPWFIGKYGVDVAAIEASIGRTRGEGLGDKLAGDRETRYLPGDRSLVALRISGGRGSRYHCEVSTHGLQTLPGGGISTTIHGRRDETLIAVVVDENWYVIERHFKDGVTERYAVTNRHGTATLYPDTGEMCQSQGWSDEGTGPTENEVRKILGLKAASTPQVQEPIPTPPPPKPVETKHAAPVAVAATLASLQGKFKRR